MQPSTSNKVVASGYARYHMWSSKISVHTFMFMATLLLVLSHLLPGKARESVVACANLLKNAAVLIVQPGYAHATAGLKVYLKIMRDILMLFGPLVFASVFAAFETLSPQSRSVGISITIPGTLILLIALCASLFAFMFGMLMDLLLLSGDLYAGKQDEMQRALAQQASAFTLRLVIILLALLFVGYLFMRDWRDLAAVHLSVLFFIARMAYLLKLFQLRWTEMADLELAGVAYFK